MAEVSEHLIVKADSLLSKNESINHTFLDNLYESALKLDPSIVEPFISEDDVFEDGSKYNFLNEIKELYQRVKEQSEEIYVTQQIGHCGLGQCAFKCGTIVEGMEVQTFWYFSDEDKTEPIEDFGFVIKKENGMFTDVMICLMPEL